MENENPAASPLETALKQLQAWFVEGSFDKVKKGAQEILQIAPNNSIAQDLLKKADDSMIAQVKSGAVMPAETVIDTAPAMDPFPAVEPSPFPTAGATPGNIPNLFPSAAPIMPSQTTSPTSMPTQNDLPIHHGHSLLINIAILIGLILVGIGLVYGYNAFFKDKPTEETTAETTTIEEDAEESEDAEPSENDTNEPEENEDETLTEEEITEFESTSIGERNEERLAELSEIEKALIEYYDENKQYPTASEINQVLVTEGFLVKIPTGPMENEIYFYAVYNNELGENQVYILTALFENPDGTLSEWTTGGSIQEFTIYTDISQDHVTVLHPTMSEEEYLQAMEETTTEESSTTEEETSTDESSTDEETEPTRIPRT